MSANPVRVLIVDDEPAILRFLRAGLGSQGHLVIEAENGQSALDALRRNRIDLIVLDLGLPDIDGLEVIRCIRGDGSTVPMGFIPERIRPGKTTLTPTGLPDAANSARKTSDRPSTPCLATV